MRNRYWQTLLTYVRHEGTRILLIVMGLFAPILGIYLMLGLSANPSRREASMSFFWHFLAVVMTIPIGAHLRRQFVDARATILPRFRTTSLSVGGVVWGSFFCWSVVFLLRIGGFPADRAIASLLPISALALWTGYCGLRAMNLLAYVYLGSLLVFAWFDESVSNAWPYSIGALLFSAPGSLVAVGVLVGLAVRLMHVREGMVEYDWSDPSEESSRDWKPRPKAAHPARRAGRWWRNSYWMAPSDRAIRRLRRSLPKGLCDLARRWATAQRLRLQIVLIGLLLLLLLLPFGPRGTEFQVEWSDVRFIQFLAAPMTLVALARRLEFFKMEILRPAPRGQFFAAVGLAVAGIHAAAWLVIHLPLIATIGFFRPEVLATAYLWQSLLVSAAFQSFLLGVVAWLCLYPRLPIAYPLVMLPIFAVSVLIFLGWNPTGATWLDPSIFAGVFLPIGAALTIAAWRRWEQTDLD